MSLCLVDWTAVAAWVQAVGSIAAIAAAIWIGKRQYTQSVALLETQHRQNLDLIEHEQRRLADSAEQDRIDEGRDLKELVRIVIDPLMQQSEERLQVLARYEDRKDPLPTDAIEILRTIAAEAEATKQQLAELRDVFVGRPRHLLVHGHLIGALGAIARVAHREQVQDGVRKFRVEQLAQAAFNAPQTPIEVQPFTTQALIEAINQLHHVFDTVGQ
ncbi:hypothetical protein IB223_14540 [Pseudoxanthomonas sp. PXM03]|nr:hypothetical protein [Pseudoxanthomonas sp. PXM03]